MVVGILYYVPKYLNDGCIVTAVMCLARIQSISPEGGWHIAPAKNKNRSQLFFYSQALIVRLIEHKSILF